MSQFNIYLERVQESIFDLFSPENQLKAYDEKNKTSNQKSNDDIQTLANLIAATSIMFLLPFFIIGSIAPTPKKYDGAEYTTLETKGKIVETAIRKSNSLDEKQKEQAIT